MALKLRRWRARDLVFELGARTLLMGVLNATPDSFSDGGKFLDPAAALAHARAMIAEGADIIDIGGESTRPGSAHVSAEDEIGRIRPVAAAVAREPGAVVSIDTYKAAVAKVALDAGAHIVNDVWGFRKDADIARVAADSGAGVILMHNREKDDPGVDMVAEVIGFLSRSVEIALGAGVAEDRIVVDPGIGFGKTHRQSMELIARLGEIGAALGFPILLGASRKRFVGHATGVEAPTERLYGTLAAHLKGVEAGAAIIRAHDVKPHRQALDMLDAIRSTVT